MRLRHKKTKSKKKKRKENHSLVCDVGLGRIFDSQPKHVCVELQNFHSSCVGQAIQSDLRRVVAEYVCQFSQL